MNIEQLRGLLVDEGQIPKANEPCLIFCFYITIGKIVHIIFENRVCTLKNVLYSYVLHAVQLSFLNVLTYFHFSDKEEYNFCNCLSISCNPLTYSPQDHKVFQRNSVQIQEISVYD